MTRATIAFAAAAFALASLAVADYAEAGKAMTKADIISPIQKSPRQSGAHLPAFQRDGAPGRGNIAIGTTLVPPAAPRQGASFANPPHIIFVVPGW